MSTPDPPTGSGTSRRRVQRFKKGGLQTQLGSHARPTISQMLLRKGHAQTPLDADEQSLAIGSFYGAPLSARMHSPHVHPAVERSGELDNDCLYLHHPSRRLDLKSPLAPAPLSPNHSPELIDNMYLTGVYSTNSATTSVFLVYTYIPEATSDDIANIISMQLNDIQKGRRSQPRGRLYTHHDSPSPTRHTPHHLPRRRSTHSSDDNDIPPPGRHSARLHRHDAYIIFSHVWTDPRGH